MSDKKFWKLEYSITLFIIFGVILLMLPVSFGSTMQARNISRWNEMYNKTSYMFKVIKAHISADILKSFNEAKNADEQEKLLLQLVKPYLRVNTDILPQRYKQTYMNKDKVKKSDKYYFEDVYFADNGYIIGMKDITKDEDEDVKFIMMFDVNGVLPPNRWGKDVFGISILEDRTVPFGEGLSLEALQKDCSKSGSGVYCSYYYIIGGGFEG